MSDLMIKVFNSETGEEEIRKMNDIELKQYEETQKQIQEMQTERANIETAKAELLKKLGITEDEAKLLLS